MTTLDITTETVMYDRLVDKIDALVLATQANGMTTLPDVLILTKRQNKMLRRYPMMKQMFGSKHKYWLGEHNLMEIEVLAPKT